MRKIALYLIIVVVVLMASVGYLLLGVKLIQTHVIKTGEITSEEFGELLNESEMFQNSWKWSCMIRKCKNIDCGEYICEEGSTAWDLISYVRQGDPSSYLIRTDETRTLFGFCESLSEVLRENEKSYLQGFCQSLQLDTSESSIALATTYLFADSYDFKYSDNPSEIGQRFKKMHDDFWNEDRLKKAAQINLDPVQVYILASMVKGECKHMEEASKIAGLYLNRLKKNMQLQCDATVQFVVERKSAKRILNEDLNIVSPYNTYKNFGLPPGPIFIVEKKYLDAVLNYEEHDDIYMCAKGDGSGWHLFTNNFNVHSKNAIAYRAYMEKLNIKN